MMFLPDPAVIARRALDLVLEVWTYVLEQVRILFAIVRDVLDSYVDLAALELGP